MSINHKVEKLTPKPEYESPTFQIQLVCEEVCEQAVNKPWLTRRNRQGKFLLTLNVPVRHNLSPDEKSKAVAAAIADLGPTGELFPTLNKNTSAVLQKE